EATAQASSDIVTVDGREYNDGDRVVFVELTGGNGLARGVTYFVRDATPNSAVPVGTLFKLAATADGSAIDITSNLTAATVINLNQRAGTVTGQVERDPVDTDEKANLGLEVIHTLEPVKQFAITCSDIPSKLISSNILTTQFLSNRMRWQLDTALDARAIEQILAAGPLFGGVGTDLIAK